MYNKVDTNLNFVEREKEIEKFWEEHDIFKKQVHQHEDADVFTFYDGPPTANGKPHIGHVLTRVIKDMIPRYQAMKGHKTIRKAGWDTHGLPVELEVEKLLGINGKEQIEEYGIEPFVEKCKESVWKYEGMWEEFSKAVGYWADMKDPYVTYHNDYIESVWWALKEIWNKGLLYKGHKIVPYCPRCGTPLSSHEVAQGYKDIKEKSAFVRFKAKGEDAYFLAWTTTPWTLPSNLALCVNPEITYVKVKQGDYTYYMAKELCEKVLGEDYTILEEMPGKSLEYKEYEPLYPYALNKLNGKKAFIVTCDDYVTTTDGSGIVHMAPAFGEDDSRVCHEYGIAFVQFVDAKGCMTADTDWPGVFVKKADPKILKDLEEKGLLFSAPNFEHSYPHCWRCDTPLLYYARETWFIRMTAVRDKLIANNKTINWIPESIGKGRFGDWLEHVQDWGLSRNRYWGTPLNIWECECGHQHAIGSIEELKSMSDNCPDDIELHRPFIDAVTIKCPHCGKEMHRVPEVIDCWFDSGSMPFAQWHYPFENKDLFDELYNTTSSTIGMDDVTNGINKIENFDYSDFRGKIIGKDYKISESEFAAELFKVYRSNKSETDDIYVDRSIVNKALDEFINFRDKRREIEEDNKNIVKEYDKIKKQVKEITKRNGDLNAYAFTNAFPGMKNIDNNNGYVSGDLMARVDVYIKAKCDQITQYSNIHTLAFTAKLDAIKESYIQNRSMLYTALLKIQRSDIEKGVK